MDYTVLAYILIALSFVLLIAELFIPTGFILVGVGAVCALVGLALLFMFGSMESAVSATLVVCLGGPIASGFFFYLWPHTPMGRRLIRAVEKDADAAAMSANSEFGDLRNKIGRVVAPLRPSGIAEFEGRRVDVITEGMMVDVGTWVKCVEVRTNRVVVRPIDKSTAGDFENADFS